MLQYQINLYVMPKGGKIILISFSCNFLILYLRNWASQSKSQQLASNNMALYAKNIISVCVAIFVTAIIWMQLLCGVRATRLPKQHGLAASRWCCASEALHESLRRKCLVEESYLEPTLPGHSPSIGHGTPPNGPEGIMNWFDYHIRCKTVRSTVRESDVYAYVSCQDCEIAWLLHASHVDVSSEFVLWGSCVKTI